MLADGGEAIADIDVLPDKRGGRPGRLAPDGLAGPGYGLAGPG